MDAIGHKLNEYRAILDELEDNRKTEKELKEARSELELYFKQYSEDTGLLFFKNDKVSVSVDDELGASVDPARWEDAYRWAVETNNVHLLHKRLSAPAVVELIAQGVQVPDYITTKPFKKVKHRRL